MTAANHPIRCSWANMANPRYLAYHDHEWGVPCHDETTLFEMLNLEGAQAGLSWETILNKRDSYRAAFDGWDAEKIARYEAHLSRGLYKAMHDLEALQARRLGGSAPL